MTPARTLSNRGEGGSNLDLPCSQIDEYLKYHHRTFIQELMGKQRQRPASEHWTEFPRSSCRVGRNENMSKEVKTMMGTPTETVHLS